MSTVLEDPDRRVVPRWRPWREAVSIGDICPVTVKRVHREPHLEDLHQTRFDWEKNRSLPFAADFLGAAFALSQGSMAIDAADFILASKQPSNKALRTLASLVLSDQTADEQVMAEPVLPNTDTSRRRIRAIRSDLHNFPRNPLALMDLAREYVGLGQPWAAIKPVREALALAPASRFVLRSASRFFLHHNDNEQAHDILRKAERTRKDPWLVSAEIAVASAAGRRSSLVKLGKQFVESKNLHPSHISELASALGTLELEAGNVRLMKKLFRKALEKPTENSLAQAAWVSRRVGNLGFAPSVLDTPRSYEAGAWTNFMGAHWKNSLAAAELWLCDEPFAKRPTLFGSWVALTTAPDYIKAERIARHGLNTHQDDFLLLNNLTVALAYQGKHREALQCFNRIPHAEGGGPYRATYLATNGLLRFRLGAPDEGRRLYRMAVDDAKHKKSTQSAVWALLHFAREEYRLTSPKGDELVKEALLEFNKLSVIERAVASRLLELVMPA